MQLSNCALHRRGDLQARAARAQHGPLWQAPVCRRLPRQFTTCQRSVGAHLIAKKDAGRNVAWTQEENSLCIGVEVDEEVRGKDVNLEVHPKRMKLAVQNETVLEGTFPADVVPDGSFFSMETADNSKLCVITIEKKQVTSERWVELFEEEKLDVTITDHAFLDISIADGEGEAAEPQRVEFGLYGAECPRTVKNFLALCAGTEGVTESGKPRHYKGSRFHRIINNFMIQGGDFTNGDGTGGESIYGRVFQDESTRIKHDQPMKLCMANAGPDTNGSQFYITLVPCPHLDGNHVVFGEVVSGQDVIKRIEEEAGSADGEPQKAVTITDCGFKVPEDTSNIAAVENAVAEETPTGATA